MIKMIIIRFKLQLKENNYKKVIKTIIIIYSFPMEIGKKLRNNIELKNKKNNLSYTIAIY
jgi:hypothetical protein